MTNIILLILNTFLLSIHNIRNMFPIWSLNVWCLQRMQYIVLFLFIAVIGKLTNVWPFSIAALSGIYVMNPFQYFLYFHCLLSILHFHNLLKSFCLSCVSHFHFHVFIFFFASLLHFIICNNLLIYNFYFRSKYYRDNFIYFFKLTFNFSI